MFVLYFWHHWKTERCVVFASFYNSSRNFISRKLQWSWCCGARRRSSCCSDVPCVCVGLSFQLPFCRRQPGIAWTSSRCNEPASTYGVGKSNDNSRCSNGDAWHTQSPRCRPIEIQTQPAHDRRGWLCIAAVDRK